MDHRFRRKSRLVKNLLRTTPSASPPSLASTDQVDDNDDFEKALTPLRFSMASIHDVNDVVKLGIFHQWVFLQLSYRLKLASCGHAEAEDPDLGDLAADAGREPLQERSGGAGSDPWLELDQDRARLELAFGVRLSLYRGVLHRSLCWSEGRT